MKSGKSTRIPHAFLAGMCAFSFTTPLEAQEFQNLGFGNAIEAMVITIDGEIEPGAGNRFEQWLNSDGADGFRVMLNSPGGDLVAAMQLGQVIRDHGYWTETGRVGYATTDTDGYRNLVEMPGECLDACALAFLGGVSRSKYSAASLGVHAFSRDLAQQGAALAATGTDTDQATMSSLSLAGSIVDYITRMGADARMFTVATSNATQAPRFFSEEDAEALNIATSDGFGPFVLTPEAGGLLASSSRIGPTHPYDLATGLTLFCQEGHPGEAWIRIETDMQGGDEAYLLDSANGMRLIVTQAAGQEQEFTIAQQDILADSGGPGETHRWFAKMGTAPIRAVLAADQIIAQIDVPRSSGGYGASHTLTETDRKMIRSAFMNCIP